jgi:hypothetical protein
MGDMNEITRGDAIALGSKDYRWLFEILYRMPGDATCTNVATWMHTASIYNADPYRFRIAVEGFFRLLGWELISVDVCRLGPVGGWRLAPRPAPIIP